MDIHSFFGASTPSSVASFSIQKKDPTDSDSDIAEPPSKKACRELIQPSSLKRILKDLEKLVQLANV